MPQTLLSLSLPQDQAFKLVDAVSEREELALVASTHETKSGEWVFEATCAGEPDIDAFNALLRETLGREIAFSTATIDPNVDWIAKSLEGLKPVVAGNCYVHGSHDGGRVPTGMTAICIEAAQAFGTGHHATTTGCLEAIDRTLRRRRPRYLLDVGTGTGVLAIALAKRTRLPVIASDIDPVAVRAATENARLNEVANEVVVVQAAGLQAAAIRVNGPYDLIVANILAGPLAGLAPAIGRAAMPGATIILSGILVSQAAKVLAAYRQQGIFLDHRIVKDEWVTLVLEKPNACGSE